MNGIVVFPNTITTEEAAKALSETGGTSFSVVYKLESTATSLSGLSGEYAKNQINQALIDSNHLLFLPAAGFRNANGVVKLGAEGPFWSVTTGHDSYATSVFIKASAFSITSGIYFRSSGASIRLATVVSELAGEEFSVPASCGIL